MEVVAMPEPSAEREKLYGQAYRNALGATRDAWDVKAAGKAKRRERRRAKSDPAGVTAQAARRGKASRKEARTQVEAWDQQERENGAEPRPETADDQPKSPWVHVHSGGLPSLGRRT